MRPCKVCHKMPCQCAELFTPGRQTAIERANAEPVSQSINSYRISESTIARIAGNLLSAVEFEAPVSDGDIQCAVSRARRIAAEVERTRPADTEPPTPPLPTGETARTCETCAHVNPAPRPEDMHLCKFLSKLRPHGAVFVPHAFGCNAHSPRPTPERSE